MEDERDRIPELESYHAPPPMPRTKLWAAIEAGDAASSQVEPAKRGVPRRGALIAASLGLLLVGGAVGYGAGRATAPEALGDDASPPAGQDAGPGASDYAEAGRVIVWF